MQKITIFSASMINNDYFNKPVQKACIDSWKYLKQAIENLGYECEIKLFDWDSAEVQSVMNLCKDTNLISKKRYSKLADLFRLEMLSINTNWLWLDGDILINSSIINDCRVDFSRSYLNENWSVIFNSNSCDFFKRLTNFYLARALDNTKNKRDECLDRVVYHDFNDADKENINSDKTRLKYMYHLCWFDTDRRFPIEDWEVEDNFIVKIRHKDNTPCHNKTDLSEQPKLLEFFKNKYEEALKKANK